jgi:hypothetical protein
MDCARVLRRLIEGLRLKRGLGHLLQVLAAAIMAWSHCTTPSPYPRRETTPRVGIVDCGAKSLTPPDGTSGKTKPVVGKSCMHYPLAMGTRTPSFSVLMPHDLEPGRQEKLKSV